MLSKKAFTLIELIIVIVIIGILAAIGIVSYTSQAAKARDARRLQDIGSIQKALSLYYAENGKYPIAPCGYGNEACYTSNNNPGRYIGACLAADGSSGYVSGTGCPVANWTNQLSQNYPDLLPNDPINNSTYYYAYYRYGIGSLTNCAAPYISRVYLTVKNFETIPAGSHHPASPEQADLTVCYNNNPVWIGNYEWIYSVLESK